MATAINEQKLRKSHLDGLITGQFEGPIKQSIRYVFDIKSIRDHLLLDGVVATPREISQSIKRIFKTGALRIRIGNMEFYGKSDGTKLDVWLCLELTDNEPGAEA